MELFDRVILNLKERRERIFDGKVNSIPINFPRFRGELCGIEQKTTYHVTASTKVGKTQISDDMFLYTPFFYAFSNREKIRLRIFYFTLEMSKEQKYQQFMCHLLFVCSQGRIRVTPKDLRSADSTKPLPQEVLDTLESEQYKAYFKFFEESVTFIDNIKNPYGIYKFMKNYADSHGVQHTKMVPFINNNTGEVESEQAIDDYYEPHDPDEYVIVLTDHLALLSAEKGGSVRESMVKFSSDYSITLRNKYKYINVHVIQQAAAQEGNENMKLGKLKPTLDGYGDAKVIARDADVIIGLFSPFRHGIQSYEGYDTTFYRDNIRFMELIAGREGGGGTVCPLFFDGGVNVFRELPLPNDVGNLRAFASMIERVRSGVLILGNNSLFLAHSTSKQFEGSRLLEDCKVKSSVLNKFINYIQSKWEKLLLF